MSVSASRAVSISTGTGRSRLDPPAHLEAVEARQHQVEDDEVGPQRVAQLDAGRAVAGDLDVEALAAQPRRDGVGDRRLVLDDDDRVLLHWRNAKRRVCSRRAACVEKIVEARTRDLVETA